MVDNRRAVVDNPANLVDILNQADVAITATADSGGQIRKTDRLTLSRRLEGAAPSPAGGASRDPRSRRSDPTSSLSERVLWHAYGLDGLEE
jgi:hypothetical protein